MAKAMVKVDSDKFYAQMLKKGLDHKDVAENLGYVKSYFTSQLSDCKKIDGYSYLPKNVTMMLQRFYGVDPETYLVKDEPKSEPAKAEQPASSVAIGYDKLREAIYLGVKEGMKEAAAEINLKEVLRDGMIAALSWDSRKETN